MKYFYKNLSIWLIIGLVALLLFNLLKRPPDNYHKIPFNEFIEKVDSGLLSAVVVKDSTISWQTADGTKYKTLVPPNNEALPHLLKQKITVQVEQDK